MCPVGTLSCTSSQLLSCPTGLNEAPGWPRHQRAACLRSCRVVSRASALPQRHIHSAVLSLRDRWPGRLAREMEGTYIEPRSELPAISLGNMTLKSIPGVSRVACRAQRGRVGGSRWGWVLQIWGWVLFQFDQGHSRRLGARARLIQTIVSLSLLVLYM